MSTKPILFNTEMVQAILDGRKTVTRRLVKPQPGFFYDVGGRITDPDNPTHIAFLAMNPDDHEEIRIPQYQPGDILYVRETWTLLYYVDPNGYTHWDQPMYYYAADGTPDTTLVDGDGFELDDQRIRWKPSIHMPKEIARLFLRVKDVRVERLQDITDEQALKEGIKAYWMGDGETGYAVNLESKTFYEGPIGAFARLWESTIKDKDIGDYGWDANPWVWVIEFEKISKEEAMKC